MQNVIGKSNLRKKYYIEKICKVLQLTCHFVGRRSTLSNSVRNMSSLKVELLEKYSIGLQVHSSPNHYGMMPAMTRETDETYI